MPPKTPKGTNTANCWKFFKIIDVGAGVKKTKYQLCNATLVYVGGSTYSMRTHFLNVHKRDPDKKEDKDDAGPSVPSQRQAALGMFRAKTKEMSVARQTEVTQSLAIMCALDLRPVSMRVHVRRVQERSDRNAG